ncbi:MAG: ATP-binding protein [Thermodesulfobacteriota bacterium]
MPEPAPAAAEAKPPQPRARRLARSLTLAMLITSAIIAGAVMSLSYWQADRAARQQLASHAAQHITFLQKSLQLPLWHLDHQQARAIAAALLQNQDVIRVRVEDTRGQEVFDDQTAEGPPALEREAEVLHQGQFLGRVLIALTMANLEAVNRESLYDSLLAVAAVMAALALALGPLLAWLLKRPLDKLLARIDGLAGGDYRQSLPELGYRELEPIVERFNVMAGEIERREVILTRGRDRLAREVRQRQEAQEALLQSEERYRRLFDTISDLIYTHDLDGRILAVNQASAQCLGLSLGEIVGRRISDFMKPELAPAFREQYLGGLTRQGSHAGIAKYRTREGAYRYIEYKSVLVAEPGQTPYVSGSGRDVTERVQREREVQTLQQQLLQAQKMEALGTLAGGVAHEFNNVLMTIRGYTQLLARRRDLHPDLERYLERIDESTRRAASLTGSMLGFSRREVEGRQQIQPARLVRELSELLRQTLPPAVSFQISLAPDAPPVLGQPNQLEQVVLNLALNARDAMPQGGALTISAGRRGLDEAFCRVHPWASPGDYLEIRVADSGEGMSEAVRQRIFEPFFTTKLPGRGTGLGLYVAYTVIKSHGGGILVESQPGRGTTFRLLLPALSAPAPDRPAAPRQAPPEAGRGQRILVADDEPQVRAIIHEALGAAGYQVDEAENGLAALGLYERARRDGRPYELVIMDLAMPVMDGLECLRRLKAQEPELKAVLATGQAEGLPPGQAGLADATLVKPFDLGALLRAVAAMMTKEDGHA